MKLRGLNLAMLLLLVTLTVGPGTPAATADSDCPPTKVFFYSTDTQNLARALGGNSSGCADYYISIMPAAGEPRGGPPLTTVHAQGTRFHALAELRQAPWIAYADVNGWYAAGVKLHDDMLDVGYDPAAGDTWAVNEVGAPSGQTINTDVFNNVDRARQHFRDFVRGLYTGSKGAPMPGVVFAADPAHLATNVDDYAQKLAAWYADAPFWEDMQRYVNVWAQESYADARAWAVPGSPLAERTGYLDDYFLHGLRVAEEGDDATAAARSFLDDTYIALANASYPYRGANPLTGIGFGYTDVGLSGMQRFISAQTYAQRAWFGTRLGFAVSPLPLSGTGPPVEAFVAAAIHDSQADPFGACTAPGESCDFDLAGATFVNSWKALANTQEGANVAVAVGAGVSVSFAGVSARGATWFSSSPTAEPPPGWDAAGSTYAIATTAVTAGPIQVCLADGSGHVFRRTDDGWLDVTTTPGCGTTHVLGAFALFVDPTPPLVVPVVAGFLGKNDWYTSDVTVTWSVTDAQSPSSITTSGCDPTFITTDTSGTTVTCTATSDGGLASTSVTVKRDATPPTINVPAAVSAEATSAAGAAVVYSVSVVDLDPSPIWTCSPTSGSVFPLGSTMVACSAADAAGNTASASFVVTVADTTAPSLSLPASFAVDATSPGGAVVSYAAAATDTVDPAPAVVCAPASSATFPIGTTTVTCTATDASGNQASGSFAVTVRDANTQISDVVASVLALDAKQGIVTSLYAKLQTVLDALSSATAGERASACQKLDAFTNEVRAQAGKSLTQAVAERLTADARRVKAVIGCT